MMFCCSKVLLLICCCRLVENSFLIDESINGYWDSSNRSGIGNWKTKTVWIMRFKFSRQNNNKVPNSRDEQCHWVGQSETAKDTTSKTNRVVTMEAGKAFQRRMCQPIMNCTWRLKNSLTSWYQMTLSKIFNYPTKRSFWNKIRGVTHQNTVRNHIESDWHNTATTQIGPPIYIPDTDRSPKKHRPVADLCHFIL